MARSIFPDEVSRERALRFGRFLFMLSLGIVFVATLIGCIAIRVHLEERQSWPEEIPSLPAVLWWTLPILAVASLTFERAVAYRRSHHELGPLRVRLAAGLALTLLFLAVQASAWRDWTERTIELAATTEEARLAVTAFFLLSGLHAAHVVGGLVAVLWTMFAARRALAETRLPAALRGCATYWHFLGVIWLLLLTFLWANVTL